MITPKETPSAVRRLVFSVNVPISKTTALTNSINAPSLALCVCVCVAIAGLNKLGQRK